MQSVNNQKQLHILRNVVEMLRDLNCCVIGQGIEKAEHVCVTYDALTEISRFYLDAFFCRSKK